MFGHYDEDRNKLWGKYRAICVDVHDPERKGRIRVYCPAVYGEDWSDWAYPNLPPNFFGLPKEGDMVWVEFEGGDPEYPIWTGIWFEDSVEDNHPPLTSRTGVVDHDMKDHESHPIDSVERKPFRDGKYYDPHVTVLHHSHTGLVIYVDDSPNKKGGLYIRDRAGNEIKILDNEDSSFVIEDMNGHKVTLGKDTIRLDNAYGTYFELGKDAITGYAKTIHLIEDKNFVPNDVVKSPKKFLWRTISCPTDPTVK